jgi:hypothetical protein
LQTLRQRHKPEEFFLPWEWHEDFFVTRDGLHKLVLAVPPDSQQSLLGVIWIFYEFRQAAIWQLLEVDFAPGKAAARA